MKANRTAYVLDAEILRCYGGIIQFTEQRRKPKDATVDLDNAHLVIPEVAVRRLAETTDNECVLITRLRKLAESSIVVSMRESYRLRAMVKPEGSNQLISILPVQKELFQYLPFHLNDEDIEDQIIATAIAASLALSDSNIGGSIDEKMVCTKVFNNVILLTNSDRLAIRAHWYGIKTSCFKYTSTEIRTSKK